VSQVTKTIDRILRGNADANIRFRDLCAVLVYFGFNERVRGDHHIFTRDGIDEILNLQPHGDKAKPYQVKQVRNLLTKYGLVGEKDSPPLRIADESKSKEDGPTGADGGR
jgi:hypothetical protein